MNDEIKKLRGSDKRDAFKWAHKNKMPNASFLASDADLVLINNKPAGVVAYLDYKGSQEDITYTEKILYDEWAQKRPVYIVAGSDPEEGPFMISKYITGGTVEFNCNVKDWAEFQEWERNLRIQHSKNNCPKEPPVSEGSVTQ